MTKATRKKHEPSALRLRFLETNPKPRKPKNAFVRFSQSERAALPPELKGGAAKITELSARWRDAPEHVKLKFRQEAAPDELVYHNAMDTWKTGFQKFTAKHVIKKPSSAFMFFKSELHRRERDQHKGKDGKQIAAIAQEKWALLSPEDRTRYTHMVALDMLRYDTQVKAKGDLMVPEKTQRRSLQAEPLVAGPKDSVATLGKHADATWFRHFLVLQTPVITKAQPRSVSKTEILKIAQQMWDRLSYAQRIRYKPK